MRAKEFTKVNELAPLITAALGNLSKMAGAANQLQKTNTQTVGTTGSTTAPTLATPAGQQPGQTMQGQTTTPTGQVPQKPQVNTGQVNPSNLQKMLKPNTQLQLTPQEKVKVGPTTAQGVELDLPANSKLRTTLGDKIILPLK